MEYKKLGVIGFCSTFSMMVCFCDNVEATWFNQVSNAQKQGIRSGIVKTDKLIQKKELATRTTGDDLLKAIDEESVKDGFFDRNAVNDIKVWKGDLQNAKKTIADIQSQGDATNLAKALKKDDGSDSAASTFVTVSLIFLIGIRNFFCLR